MRSRGSKRCLPHEDKTFRAADREKTSLPINFKENISTANGAPPIPNEPPASSLRDAP
jgi:hypothetical protein